MPVASPQITPELAKPPREAPTLDPTLFKPALFNDVEKEFLHSLIARNDTVLMHKLLEAQKEAYKEYPYPCIWAFRFACLKMHESPIYERVLQAGKADSGALFLDLGCCMGTEVRKLARDGYPAAQIIGCDLRQPYITSGYKLFGDKDTCRIRFITSDVFALPAHHGKGGTSAILIDKVSTLNEIIGRVKYLYTGSLFHLFNEDTQFAVALRLITLLKRSPGSIIFGRHQAFEVEGMIDDRMGRSCYAHSPSSWTTMWHRAFSIIEGEAFSRERVKVQAALSSQRLSGFTGNGSATLIWSVQILR